jgi:hypothetical protein
MAPKHAETYLSEARIDELNNMLESHGLDHAPVGGLEFIDRALSSGWKLPSTAKLQAHHAADSKPPKKLVTTAVHMAREFLGEPVGHKKEQA